MHSTKTCPEVGAEKGVFPRQCAAADRETVPSCAHKPAVWVLSVLGHLLGVGICSFEPSATRQLSAEWM